MDENRQENPETKTSPLPRHLWIELVQMASLFALAFAWFLFWTGKAPFGAFSLVLFGAILCALSFFLVKEIPPEGYPEATHGFRLNRQRLRTLGELGIPEDVIEACGHRTILGEHFAKGADLRNAIYDLLGEERAEPYARTILLHARLHRAISASTAPKAKSKQDSEPDFGNAPLRAVRAAD